MSLRSYGSIFNLGHRALAELFNHEVIVEEKIDASQFSFGLINGELKCRSKGTQINMVAPEGMFSKGVALVKELEPLLTPGYIYRGEYFNKPKHNTLAYTRMPNRGVMIWDIDTALECYLPPAEKAAEAVRIGLECVPLLFTGKVDDLTSLRRFLEMESILGGQKIEGVVIKPAAYNLWNMEKKLLIAKLVSEDFREVHSKTWSKEHGTQGGADFVTQLASRYNTQARWQKARQHLMEAGGLLDDMRDMPKLLAEVPLDIELECKDEIKDALWAWAWPQLKRGLTKGMAEWLKEQLAKAQFEAAND